MTRFASRREQERGRQAGEAMVRLAEPLTEGWDIENDGHLAHALAAELLSTAQIILCERAGPYILSTMFGLGEALGGFLAQMPQEHLAALSAALSEGLSAGSEGVSEAFRPAGEA